MIQQRISLLKPLILSQKMMKRAYSTSLFTFKPSTLIFSSTPYRIVKRFTHSGKFPKIIPPKPTRVPPHNPSINQTPLTKTNTTEIWTRLDNQRKHTRSLNPGETEGEKIMRNVPTSGKSNMWQYAFNSPQSQIQRQIQRATNHLGVENTTTNADTRPSNSTNDTITGHNPNTCRDLVLYDPKTPSNSSSSHSSPLTTSPPSAYTSNTCRDLVPFVPSTSSPTPSPRNIVPQPSSSSLANIALQRLLSSPPTPSTSSCTALVPYSPPSLTSTVHDSSPNTNKAGLPTLSEPDIIISAKSSNSWDNWDHTKLQLLSSLSPNADIGIYITNLKELQFIKHDENPLESVKNHPGCVGKIDKELYNIYQQNKNFKYKSVEITFSDLINQDNYSVGMLFANNDTVVLDGRHKHHNIFIDVPGGKLCPGYFTSHKEGVLISDKQPFGQKKQYCTKINPRKPLWFIENDNHIIPLSPDKLKIWEDYISKDDTFNKMTNAIFENYSDECKNDAKKPYNKKENGTILDQEGYKKKEKGTMFKPISRPPIITTDGDTDLYDPSSKLQINCRVYDPTGITGPELHEINTLIEEKAQKEVNSRYTEKYKNNDEKKQMEFLVEQRTLYQCNPSKLWWWPYFEKLIKETNDPTKK